MNTIVVLEVEEVTVLQREDCSDRIYLKFKGPLPFPEFKDKPSFQMDVAKGFGVKYVRDTFNLEPKIIISK